MEVRKAARGWGHTQGRCSGSEEGMPRFPTEALELAREGQPRRKWAGRV